MTNKNGFSPYHSEVIELRPSDLKKQSFDEKQLQYSSKGSSISQDAKLNGNQNLKKHESSSINYDLEETSSPILVFKAKTNNNNPIL